MRTGTALVAGAIVAGVAFLAGCGQGSEGTTAQGALTSAPPAATATPPAGLTAIPEVDAVIEAVSSGDPEALRPLIRYSKIGCVAELVGIGSPPKCDPGEAVGTLVDVLPAAQCEGYYVRLTEIDSLLAFETAPGRRLYAVFRMAGASSPAGKYVIVFSQVRSGRDTAAEIVVDGGGVSGVNHGCGESPEETVRLQQLQDPLIGPFPDPPASPALSSNGS